jgi:hypothetical protein
MKVTIAEPSTIAIVSNFSYVHMDVRFIFQARYSAAFDKIPTVVTVTE